ncbi:hypothetical protein [Amycolatopsis mediterranei]|uniref:Uncharacterized protein n=1 Tax=Amycolatopsis mediterranei (strain S699) TaxID=713604 RepID=A0A9R0U5S4_AMYMS|nr:hypothetical protein [Amycolatopsis mediterranei]AEK38835.1 hypothetical protein RAM_01715 [Amycolatopsis mediterranei S699]UZF67332.1 hypothetical protein ISP_000328 [Amycolatopsis mediterranei]
MTHLQQVAAFADQQLAVDKGHQPGTRSGGLDRPGQVDSAVELPARGRGWT